MELWWWLQVAHRLVLLSHVLRLAKHVYSVAQRLRPKFPTAALYVRFWLLYPLIRLVEWRRRRNTSFSVQYEDAFDPKRLKPTEEEERLEKRDDSAGKVELIRFFAGDDGTQIEASVTFCGGVAEASLLLRHKDTTLRLPSALRRLRPSEDAFTWSAGGLRLQLREPMRKWKLDFVGYLRDQEGKDRFVNFEAFFAPCSDAFFPATLVSQDAIALSLAESSSLSTSLASLRALLGHDEVDQMAMLTARLSVDGLCEEEELVLRGFRQRVSRTKPRTPILEECRELLAYFANGEALRVRLVDLPDYASEVLLGYRSARFGEQLAVTGLAANSFAAFPERCAKLSFESGGEGCLVSLEGELGEELVEVVGRRETRRRLLRLSLNGQRGWGLVTVTRKAADPTQPHVAKAPMRLAGLVEASGELVLSLANAAVADSQLSGGKAANLCVLTALQKKFTVPAGVVVTTNAYQAFLAANPAVKNLIHQIEKLDKRETQKLTDLVTSLEDAVKIGTIPTIVSASLTAELDRLGGADSGDGWAVRSSAVGEDGSELSSAGQLETFLGLRSIDDVLAKLRLCWASNFRREVSEYRHRHGQPLTPAVAVVVQRLVQPDAAGVLFTQDPLSHDPRLMVINATRGLGEAVVDGSSIPDTVRLRSSPNGRQIVERNSEDGSDVCLSDDLTLQLAGIASELASAFGAPQDIEFAVKGGRVFLLQSRDITTALGDSDWALKHELDTGLVGEGDVLSTGNVGEVMPEAMSPLAATTAIIGLERAIQAQMVSQGNAMLIGAHRNRFCSVYRQRCFVNFVEGMYRSMKDMVNGPQDTEIFEIAFMGRLLDESMEIVECARQRFPKASVLTRIRGALAPWLLLVKGSKSMLQRQRDLARALPSLDLTNRSPADLLRLAEACLGPMGDSTQRHSDITVTSMFYIILAASVLRGKAHRLSTANLNDIAGIFASCAEAISADVPKSLRRIAAAIRASGQEDQFVAAKTDQEAVDWLKDSSRPDVASHLASFAELFGHRCPQEFDVARRTWGQAPELLLPQLRQMLKEQGSLERTKSVVSESATLAGLETKLGRVERGILRFVLPRSRRSVEHREAAKSLCIDVVHRGRLCYTALGEELARRGLLPSARLVFSFTAYELGRYVAQPSPALLQRAVKRERLLKEQDRQSYAEVMFNGARPDEPLVKSSQQTSAGFSLSGTQVCLGTVRGRARVALTLAEAQATEPGEILITKSTDIGWSPLFPIIGGIVTELGGLLSHGAVVAREYGLPCLIGAKGATAAFATGDAVELAADQGLLRRIEE